MKFERWYTIKEIREMDEAERLRTKKKQIHEDLKDEVERKWVGLTNSEIQDIADRIKVDDLLVETSTWHIRFARAIQRKLKEKNA